MMETTPTSNKRPHFQSTPPITAKQHNKQQHFVSKNYFSLFRNDSETINDPEANDSDNMELENDLNKWLLYKLNHRLLFLFAP